MDKSWVVLYNPALLLKYLSHINVEVVHVVNYIFKYITKGTGRLNVVV